MAINVCDICIERHEYARDTLEKFGKPDQGDWCFNCGRVYDMRIKRHMHKVMELNGRVHEVPGHNIDGWRRPMGLELMEMSIANFEPVL